MGDHGQRHRPPTTADPGQREQAHDHAVVLGGGVQADREWAQRRIGNFFRAQKIHRKAEEGTDAGAGEHDGDNAKVSQPGEPAEQEADAVADHVAGKLHGDKGAEGEAQEGAAPEAGKEEAPEIGAKLQPGAISLAKKGDKNQQQQPAQQPNRAPPGEVQPVPKTLPAFPSAKKVKPKTPMGGGQLRPRYADDEFIYEFDRQHGTVEKYDKRGKHLGEFDIHTGAQTKPANPTRRIDP